MKIYFHFGFALFLGALGIASCQESTNVNCRIELRVLDDAAKPVSGAGAFVRYPVGLKVNPGGGFPTDRHETAKSETDATGHAILSYSTVGSPEGLLWIRKDGYYDTIYKEPEWKKSGDADHGWISKIDTILKPVKNPVPMHAIQMTGQRAIVIPEMDKEYGYDLEKAALTAPFGNGLKADFTIRISGDYRNGTDARIVATIHFSDKEDGLVYFETPNREMGSSFLGEYHAPEGGYRNMINFTFDSSEVTKNMSRKNDGNYYFRIRTIRDSAGNAIRSSYGKIHGDITFWPLRRDQGGVAQITWIASYFNPTPNDRNVEFDPKRNLNPNGNVQKP